MDTHHILPSLQPDLDFSNRCLNPGDVIIATGEAGTYGTAIEAVRRNIEPLVTADGAPLIDIVHSLLRVVPQTRRLIFPFEGINRTLKNLELTHNTNIVRSTIPISDAVGTACSIMGLDPLDMACAGMMLAIVPESNAQEAIAAIRRSDYGNRAAIIGHIA